MFIKNLVTFFLCFAGCLSAAVLDCTAGGSFSNWGSVVRCDLKRSNGVAAIKIKGGDSFLTISKLDIDSSLYDQIEFEYRAKDLPEKNSGQIYFSGKNQSFGADRMFFIRNLRPDWKWHKVVIAKEHKGKKNWRKTGKITKLRLDITDCKTGCFEVRKFRVTDSRAVTAVYPGEDDFADISAKHLHIVRMGKKHKNPFWIGKSNQHDHQHRGIFRFPLEKLIPREKVSQAVLELRLLWYSGKAYDREYAVEVYPDDIQKIKPLDVKMDAVEIGRFRMGQYSVCETAALDVTAAVNAALEKIHTAFTVRIRPVPETNTEPNPSGAVVDTETVRLVIR